MTAETTPGPGLHAALKSEREARKTAEREVKQLQARVYALQDEAELWRYRAKANRERLRALQNQNTDERNES